MGLWDWIDRNVLMGGGGGLLGDDSPEITYAQSPEQAKVYEALLPLLQRLNVASSTASGGNKDPYMTRYNRGYNPYTGQRLNARTYNLPTQRQAYQKSATGSNTSQLLALANINKKRVEQGQTPITLDQLRSQKVKR